MPSAHVLHAFLLRMARHSRIHPTWFAARSVYWIAFQPPADVIGFTA
jgi:hypothetical protein